jgi:hypothetical protein
MDYTWNFRKKKKRNNKIAIKLIRICSLVWPLFIISSIVLGILKVRLTKDEILYLR